MTTNPRLLETLARECKGWTLRDLIERESGVSNALISQIETGHVKDPGFSIAKPLGISADRPASTAFNFKDAMRGRI